MTDRHPGAGMAVVMVETGGWGGLGHYSHCLCEALAHQGIAVSLATHRKRYALGGYSKRYDVIPCFSGDGFATDWTRLLAILLRRRPRIVHFQSLLAPRRDWIPFWVARCCLRRTAFVVTAHNILPHEVRPLEPPAYRLLYRAASGIIVHSRASLSALKQLVRLSAKTLQTVIPHGHYGMIAAPVGLSRSDALRLLNLDDYRYLLFFGTIRPYKGVENLLQAVAHIPAWPPDLKVLIAGHPFSESEGRRIEAMVRQLAISDRVLCRLQYFPENRIPALFRIADLVLLPYRHIDHSGVLMAALASGRPILASPVGVFPEIIDRRIGFLSRTPASDDIRRAMIHALANRERWAAMGARAAAIAHTRYGWNTIAARTVEFYRNLTGSGGRTLDR